jgi:hypothetical protein
LSPTARVYYSFHPYANQTFKVLQRASGKAGQITVELSAGKTLTLPLWMLQPEASLLQIGSTVDIPCPVLLEIVDLIRANCSAGKRLFDALEQPDGSTQLPLSRR